MLTKKRKIIIMGAAGRDFHNFNTLYRDNDSVEVVAFTATQIPDIEGRRYPDGAGRQALSQRDPDPRREGTARPDQEASGRRSHLLVFRRFVSVRHGESGVRHGGRRPVRA